MTTALDLTPQDCVDLISGLAKRDAEALQRLVSLEPLASLKIGDVEFQVVTLSPEHRGAYVAVTHVNANTPSGQGARFEDIARDEALIVRLFLDAAGWKGDFETLRPHLVPEDVWVLKVEFWRQVHASAMWQPENWAGRA